MNPLAVVEPAGNVPLHLQLEVTWRCNWRCVHCYQDRHDLEPLSGRQLQQLVRALAAAGTMHVIITGGEPLVRRDLFEVLDEIRAHRMATTLYTNGQRVDARTAAALGDRIAVAELSVLAGDARVHDELTRTQGSFARAWRAARLLRSHGVAVVIKTPVLRAASGTLKALADRAEAEGLEWHPDPEISRTYLGASYPLDHRLDDEGLQRFRRDFPRYDPSRALSNDAGAEFRTCRAGRQHCFIDALGNVYPCLNFKSPCDVAEVAGAAALARLGNVLRAPFGEIWSDAPLARRIRTARRSELRACPSCGGSAACRPCMALNYQETGDLFVPGKASCRSPREATRR